MLDGGGGKRIKLDQPNFDNIGSRDQKSFGIGTLTPHSNIDTDLGPPALHTNFTSNYDWAFTPSPGSHPAQWQPHLPLFLISKGALPYPTILTQHALITAFREDTAAKQQYLITTPSKDENEYGMKIVLDEVRSHLKQSCQSMDDIMKTIKFIGVAAAPPQPFLQSGVLLGDESAWRGPMNVAVTTTGSTMFPDVFNSTQEIAAGQKLFMIIKPVALRNTTQMPGEYRKSDSNTVTGRETTVHIIFYTNPDNLPPPRADIAVLNTECDQPPVESMQYREWVEHKKLKGKNISTLKDGLVYQIGCATHRFKPSRLNIASNGNKQSTNNPILTTMSDQELAQKEKFQVHIEITRIY